MSETLTFFPTWKVPESTNRKRYTNNLRSFQLGCPEFLTWCECGVKPSFVCWSVATYRNGMQSWGMVDPLCSIMVRAHGYWRLLDTKMWLATPYGGCDAIAEPLGEHRPNRAPYRIALRLRNGVTMWRAPYSSTLTWLVDGRWGWDVLYEHKLTSLTSTLLREAQRVCLIWLRRKPHCSECCTVNGRRRIDHAAPLT
jgi:hypothetical protein